MRLAKNKKKESKMTLESTIRKMHVKEIDLDEAKMTFGTKRIPDAMKKKGMDKVKTKGLNKDKSSAAYIGKMKKEEDEVGCKNYSIIDG